MASFSKRAVFLGASVAVLLIAAAVVLLAENRRPDRAAPAPAEPGRGSVTPPGASPGEGQQKLTGDLTQHLKQLQDTDRVRVIVLLQEPVSPELLERLQKQAGEFEVGAAYSSIDGFAATMSKQQILHLVPDPAIKSIEKDQVVGIS